MPLSVHLRSSFFVETRKNALQSVNVNDQTVFPGGLNSETKWVLFLPRREYVGAVRNLQFSRNTTVIGKRQPHAYPFLSAHDFGGKGMGPFIPSDVDPVLDVAIDSKIETHGREGKKKQSDRDKLNQSIFQSVLVVIDLLLPTFSLPHPPVYLIRFSVYRLTVMLFEVSFPLLSLSI